MQIKQPICFVFNIFLKINMSALGLKTKMICIPFTLAA